LLSSKRPIRAGHCWKEDTLKADAAPQDMFVQAQKNDDRRSGYGLSRLACLLLGRVIPITTQSLSSLENPLSEIVEGLSPYLPFVPAGERGEFNL